MAIMHSHSQDPGHLTTKGIIEAIKGAEMGMIGMRGEADMSAPGRLIRIEKVIRPKYVEEDEDGYLSMHEPERDSLKKRIIKTLARWGVITVYSGGEYDPR